jgi:tRNA threonylcarbamoyladenosine biosynthesis protein TsaE
MSFYGKENEVSSPTFTIINEYKLNNDLSLFHFDVYRLDNEDEFYAIGGDEYFENGISLIEWGEKIKSALPKEYLEIKFEKLDENPNIRTLELLPHGDKYINIVQKIAN